MILDGAFYALAALDALLIAGLWACLLESVRLARAPAPPPAPLLPMTLIKPVKGLDEDLAGNFESIAAADPRNRLQVVIALESRQDPAWPVARAFAERHPERDVLVLEAGPSRGRMGKAHNMIEALARAKHPRVIFSDADVETTPRLLAETSAAFSEGNDAVFAVPRQRRGTGLTGVLLEIAMNHSFGLGAALGWRAIGFTHCAGAWMGYTRDVLERAGGLEPIARSIADDFALSQRVRAAGARGRLISAPVLLREAGATIPETLKHLQKWAIIIRWSLPLVYLAVPLLNLALLALALLGLSRFTGRHAEAATALAALSFGSRGLVALLYDSLAGEGALPLPWYPLLCLIDLGALFFWLSGFRSQLSWRGTRYRLKWGGECEVVSRDGHPAVELLS